jgi:hypothetical protein
MYQKDFIMRLIEEAVDSLAQILGLRARNQPLEALRLVEQATRRFIGLEPAQLDLIPHAMLRELLSVGGQPDLPRLLLLAELRRLEGEIRDDLKGAGEGSRQALSSLRLFLEVAEASGTASLGEYSEQMYLVASRLELQAPGDPEVGALLERLRSLPAEDEHDSSA